MTPGAGQSIGVSAAGSDIAVRVNGAAAETRPASMVKSLDISATDATALKVDATAGVIAAPINFDGGTTGTSSVEVAAPASTWTVSGGTGSVAGPVTLAFSNVFAITATGAGHTLAGPSTDSTWTVNGAGVGSLGPLSFNGFTNLTGAAGNRDTFVFAQPAGRLTGVVDGGAGGYDALVVNGGNTVTSSSSDSSSGTVTVDGHVITYKGLEPVTVSGAPNVVVNLTTSTDTVTVTQSGGNVTVSGSTVETILISGATSIKIDGIGGTDSVTVTGMVSLPGASFELRAETITVGSGTTIDTTGVGVDGSITLAAGDEQTGSSTLGYVAPTALSLVSINAAVLKSGSITLSATSTVTPASPTDHYMLLNANSTATVEVLGESELRASGDITLAAASTVTSAMTANGDSSQTDPSFDAAIAGSLVSSTANSHISGNSVLGGLTPGSRLGALLVSATNTVDSSATGDASSAGGGAGIAIGSVTQTTRAYIDGGVSVRAASSNVSADADGSAQSSSLASPNGSSGNSDGDSATDDSPSHRTAHDPADATGNAHTYDGSVAIAGSLSFSRLSSTTEAYVAGSGGGTPSVDTSGAQKIHAGSKAKSSAKADGRAVDSTGSGVGVAIAVNLADVTTNAHVGTADLRASSIVVEATIPTTAKFLAQSISGAGDGSSYTVAGSLAVSVISISTVAGVDASALVDATGTDLAFAATSAIDSSVSATPAPAAVDSTAGGNVGIGASVAVHVVTATTEAKIGHNAGVTADDVTLESTSTHTVTTQATGGAAGGTAITPVVAVTITTLTTSATLGTGVTLGITGNFAAHAIDNGSPVTTQADGDTNGENAAIGASVAVGYADHKVLATTASSFDALGHTVEFRASGNSATDTSATASANGSSDASSGAATPDMQVASQRTLGNGAASGNGATGSGSSPIPPASSSSGSMTAAAAVAVNIANTTSSADLPSGLTINSAGLTLWSSAATDAKANADGSATAARGPPATIGAAVAINYANVTNSATVAGTANGPATVKALVTSAGDAQSDFSATATSGAGGGNVSIAGALALNIVNLTTTATIAGTVNAGNGDVSIAAASSADSSADASAAQAPADGTGAASSLGIGASVAIALIDDTTTASLTGTLTGGHDLALSANTVDGATSSSKTGAAGGNVTIVPSVAIMLSNITTIALVAPLADLNISGAFGASADQSASAGTNAEGDAEGSSAAIGVSLALTIANHRTEATLARNLIAGGAVSLSQTARRIAPQARPPRRRARPVSLPAVRAAAASTTRSRTSAASPTRRRPRPVEAARVARARRRTPRRARVAYPSRPRSRSTSRRPSRSPRSSAP